MTLFQRGFAKYLDSGKFSDLTLVCEGEFYKVHKIVLVYSSEFFSRLLRSEFKESQQPEITLGFPDSDKVFPLVLKFMYTGELPELNLINSLPILAFADHYLIRHLQLLCSDYIKKQINRINALDVLKKALPLQQLEVIEACASVVSKNFSKVSTEYVDLPLWVFQKVLHHKYLDVKSEYDLYQTICAYVSSNEDEISESQRNELFEAIRFRWMPIEQLMECEKNELVPRNLILETIMSRLRKYECPDREEVDNSLRNQKRITCLTFEYKYDFDDRGILHYIATSGDTEKWQNPHNTGRVKVTASSIEVGNVLELLSKTPSELWTKDVPASWFTIDFGPTRSVMPTHYSLRHGGNYRADSLRTWDLQGSVDGKNWVVLRRHNQDMSLTDKFATHTWALTMDKPQELRMFRILQTGRNSSNHNFLVLSGVEFYGDLYEWKTD